MVWWPFGSQPNDPVSNLDPKLRAFLEKESPVKYNQTTSAPGVTPPPAQRPAPAAETAQEGSESSALPTASLYQDGRYAHLWKNYRPQGDIEAEVASDHDRLMSVYEGYQERKNMIQTIALENCAVEQEEWTNCMKHGKIEDQMQMCRHQVRRFEKCYMTQSRFLRALGYGSVPGRSPMVDEDIQMHADALYQRVLQHETAVEEARKADLPVPVFDPVVPRAKRTLEVSEEIQAQWKSKLDSLPEDERPAEEAALRADLQVKTDVARSMKQVWDAKAEERKIQNGGQPTILDQVSSIFRGGK